jgi:hypothetical protein
MTYGEDSKHDDNGQSLWNDFLPDIISAGRGASLSSSSSCSSRRQGWRKNIKDAKNTSIDSAASIGSFSFKTTSSREDSSHGSTRAKTSTHTTLSHSTLSNRSFPTQEQDHGLLSNVENNSETGDSLNQDLRSRSSIPMSFCTWSHPTNASASPTTRVCAARLPPILPSFHYRESLPKTSSTASSSTSSSSTSSSKDAARKSSLSSPKSIKSSEFTIWNLQFIRIYFLFLINPFFLEDSGCVSLLTSRFVNAESSRV